jgi:cytoskeletal protein RodZ
MKNKKVNQSSKSLLYRLMQAFVLLVMIAAIGIAGYYGYKSWSKPKTANPVVASRPITIKGTGQNGQSTKTPSGVSSSFSASTTGTTPTTTAPTPTISGKPSAPSGIFVSDYTPNLNGSPHPNQESSDCVTTPGATCYIEFTQGSTAIELPTELTDSTGTAYWNSWTLQGIGLLSGKWTVTAVAASTNQTVSTQSQDKLEVSP